MRIHCVKFGYALLRLANFPASNCANVRSPDIVGYFFIGGGEGTFDVVIFVKDYSKTLSTRSPNIGAQDPCCL